MIGMLILQLPYAPMVGALVGVTALIPVVGAFVGTIIGAYVDPDHQLHPGRRLRHLSAHPAADQRHVDLSQGDGQPGEHAWHVDHRSRWSAAASAGRSACCSSVPITCAAYTLLREATKNRERQQFASSGQ
ncbi:MAG: hypothetical protein V8T10_10685 [Merdibacter sp.]